MDQQHEDMYVEMAYARVSTKSQSLERQEASKLATTTSSGGLLLALQRAMLLLAQKGGIASTFTGPL